MEPKKLTLKRTLLAIAILAAVAASFYFFGDEVASAFKEGGNDICGQPQMKMLQSDGTLQVKIINWQEGQTINIPYWPFFNQALNSDEAVNNYAAELEAIARESHPEWHANADVAGAIAQRINDALANIPINSLCGSFTFPSYEEIEDFTLDQIGN